MNGRQTTIAVLKEQLFPFNQVRGWSRRHNSLHLAISIEYPAEQPQREG